MAWLGNFSARTGFEAMRRDGQLKNETAIIDLVLVRVQGAGERSSPSPVDLGKPGRKFTFVVNRQSVLVAVRAAGANDKTQLLPIVTENYPAIPGRQADPERNPKWSSPTPVPASDCDICPGQAEAGEVFSQAVGLVEGFAVRQFSMTVARALQFAENRADCLPGKPTS